MTQTNPPRKSQKSRCRVSPEWKTAALRAAVEREDQREHRAQFADGENGNERERIHAADISLAIGDVHRSPQQAGADGGENSADRAVRVRDRSL